MNTRGYGVLREHIPRAVISEVVALVADLLRQHNGEYFSCFGAEPVAGSFLEKIGRSASFRRFLARIYEHGLGKPAPPSKVYQVLRVVAGKRGLRQSNLFHFDAYVVTALIPIQIPTAPSEPRGDLVLYPSFRRIRSRVLHNLLEKIALQNPVVRSLFASRLVRRLFNARVIRMEPGNIYLFWGYQSLHANEPCNPDRVRATALFHFGDPHIKSRLVQLIERRHLRNWRR